MGFPRPRPVPGTLDTHTHTPPTHPAEDPLSPQSSPGKEVQPALRETPNFSTTSDICDGPGVQLGGWGPRPPGGWTLQVLSQTRARGGPSRPGTSLWMGTGQPGPTSSVPRLLHGESQTNGDLDPGCSRVRTPPPPYLRPPHAIMDKRGQENRLSRPPGKEALGGLGLSFFPRAAKRVRGPSERSGHSRARPHCLRPM